MKYKYTIFLLLFSFTLYSQNNEWKVWNTSNEESSQVVDHSEWSYFLGKYVLKRGGMNLVNYKDVTLEDRTKLDTYIDYLSAIKVTGLNRMEQKVYWINLYNALTVKIILDHYPVKSIRDIKLSGFFTAGPWKKKLVIIESRDVSLDDIEHRILRPIWRDKRIHYALNCASMGCPPIQSESFNSENISKLLTMAEADFINSKFGVDFRSSKLILSSIFKWFSEDFGNNEGKIISYIESILEADKRDQFQKLKADIEYRYDWSLNQF